jgi:hypothetical protein
MMGPFNNIDYAQAVIRGISEKYYGVKTVYINMIDRHGKSEPVELMELYRHPHGQHHFPLWRNWQAHIFPICCYYLQASDEYQQDIEAYFLKQCRDDAPDIIAHSGGGGGSTDLALNQLRQAHIDNPKPKPGGLPLLPQPPKRKLTLVSGPRLFKTEPTLTQIAAAHFAADQQQESTDQTIDELIDLLRRIQQELAALKAEINSISELDNKIDVIEIFLTSNSAADRFYDYYCQPLAPHPSCLPKSGEDGFEKLKEAIKSLLDNYENSPDDSDSCAAFSHSLDIVIEAVTELLSKITPDSQPTKQARCSP